MNSTEPDKKKSAKKINGRVAAVMSLVNATRDFESYFLNGISNSEHRYIEASSQNSDYILLDIPATWKSGHHDLKDHPKVIKFERSAGFPTDSSWYAKRGDILITDTSNENFSGTFVCYESAEDGKNKPGLTEGTFKINFTSNK